MFRRLVMFLAVLVLIISANGSFVMSEEPNVGILRVDSFRVPREVAPNSVYSVMIDVLYNLHKRPNNATIRAAIYEGDVNFSNPLWQSDPVIVSNGGDEIWNVSLTSPAMEGYLQDHRLGLFPRSGSLEILQRFDQWSEFQPSHSSDREDGKP